MKQCAARFGLLGLMALIVTGMMVSAVPGTTASGAARSPTPFPTPTLIPAGTSNTGWTPVEGDFDGVPMVLVPAGCFMMGSTAYDDEMPVHEICFDQPFWIDKYEVTNGRYGSSGRWSGDELPRESISWFDSKAFCESRGARLPTEAEWEYAARGPENKVYPWGNSFTAGNVVYWDNSEKMPAPVGSRPGGASWVGALDMSGNVWEWVSSLYQAYPYQIDDGREADTGTRTDVRRVLRGGSWLSSVADLRASTRNRNIPDYGNDIVGWRCARPYQPTLLYDSPVRSGSTIRQWVPARA